MTRRGAPTFTVKTVFLFLGVCRFAAGVIKGEKVERKVTKIVLYSTRFV